jgi:hypothetical protein
MYQPLPFILKDMKRSIYILLILFSVNLYGQKPFREIIETDSSTIEIIRNSVYRCYEETYKNKDSIWWSVSYIDDTTQLFTEGWKTKSDKYLGTWNEYNRQGELMYTWNHDNGLCEVNPRLYPIHDLLVKMKLKTDSIIIKTYSKDFFEKHVKFNYECNAYYGYHYLGSWIEPLKGIPNNFLIRYDLLYDSIALFSRGIELRLDSVGNYVADEENGFEKLSSDSQRVFSVNKFNIIEKAKKMDLQFLILQNIFVS